MSDLRKLNPDTVNAFKEMVKKSKLSESELLEQLMGLQSSYSLTDDEQLIVNEAVSNGANELELISRGLVAEAKYYNSTRKTLSEYHSMKTSELKTKRVRGVAEIIIERAYKAIQQHNEYCENVADKIMLTESTVFKITGSNRQTIKAWFEANSKSLDAYNQSQGFKPNHRNSNVASIDMTALDVAVGII